MLRNEVQESIRGSHHTIKVTTNHVRSLDISHDSRVPLKDLHLREK